MDRRVIADEPVQWPTEAEAIQEAKQRNEASLPRGVLLDRDPAPLGGLDRRATEVDDANFVEEILGVSPSSWGVYLVVWLFAVIGHPYFEEPQYEVGDCLDSTGHVGTCADPDAVAKLVREAESPSSCRQQAYYEVDWPPVFPWIPEDGFCAAEFPYRLLSGLW